MADAKRTFVMPIVPPVGLPADTVAQYGTKSIGSKVRAALQRLLFAFALHHFDFALQ